MSVENIRKAVIELVKVTKTLSEVVLEQDKRIEELEKDLSELTITNDYQRVISEKNERISSLEIELEELKKKG